MRFARFEHEGETASGVVVDAAVHPLTDGADLQDLIGEGLPVLLDAGRDAREAGSPVPLTEVRMLPPVRPATIRDYTSFEQHLEAMAGSVPERWFQAPPFYFSNPYAVVAHEQDVELPPGCADFDLELEVAAVIGPAGRDLTVERARDHIVGYTILNDWSARDLQTSEMSLQLGPAKGKDTATSLGPYLITADELEPYRTADGLLDLRMSARVNDRELKGDTLASSGWTFEALVAYASRGTWVRPGDVIGSGTCGDGCLAEMRVRYAPQDWPWLRPGDEVALTVDGLGTLRNRVVAGVEPVSVPAARRRS
jgi:2-keto-4-pentenoate hydratase/2-oxohepta-3-ene-1,7-dioic acid hydratase in catechol pathway